MPSCYPIQYLFFQRWCKSSHEQLHPHHSVQPVPLPHSHKQQCSCLARSDSHARQAGKKSCRFVGGMEDEILSLLDQKFDFLQVDTAQRIHIVMDFLFDRTCRIEEFWYCHHTHIYFCDKDTHFTRKTISLRKSFFGIEMD